MPAYAYKGMDARGRTVSGVRDAESPRSLRATLRREGLFVTECQETRQEEAERSRGLGREVDLKAAFDRVRPQDIAVFTRQLGTLLKAGIPLAEALQALLEQATSQKLGRALAEIRTKVNEGTALGDALSDHPNYFSELYVNMVRAGEMAGNLEQVLLRLADFLDAQIQLNAKVSGAMLYPAVMGVIALAITSLLMIVVVPKITLIFSDIGKALPWYTQLLITVSDIVSGYWWLLLLLGIGGWQLFRRWLRTVSGRLHWDGIVLRLWVAGPMVRMVALSRFARTLGTMLGSGVPLLRALEVVKAILGNRVLMGVVDEARGAIREGESIAEPLARSGHFPPVVTRMIAVGERSGELESMLATIADAYETDVDLKLSRMTRLLEPLMILVMGIIVGFIVYSILMPIFQMTDMVGG